MAAPLISPRFQWETAAGLPLVGGKLNSYAAGTSTPQATFTDSTLATPNANPVILDANGSASVWLGSSIYKFVLTDSLNNTIWTADNVSEAGVAGTTAPSEWTPSGLTPTFISATSFSVVGDQRTVFTFGRRLQSSNTGGTIYSTVTASSFGGGITTVTVVNDSGVLDSGLSAVNVGIQNATNTSAPARSIGQSIWGHSTDALSTGAALTLNTTNGFTFSTSVPGATGGNLGEFSSTTGLFTASRAGWYQVNATAELNSTGVTFNGATLLQATGTSSIGTFTSGGREFTTAVAGTNRVNASVAGLVIFAAGQTIGFQILATFSAGTPVFVQGSWNIMGPM